MEPFALLNLLKSLLPDAQKTGETPSAPPPDTTPSAPVSTPSQPAEKEQNNACLDFFNRHDARVKRTKKP